jgi:3-hydroxymyristoyl/3-hydroxydecanoyl-(acyl carrier protein) dehydratase
MVCHFVDDRVMPGTLMYECCLHTLRIFLLRLGWVGEAGKVAFEPVPGIANRLKCRGQIIESSKLVAYEITIKERGYRPEPYAIADALIVADGKAIVEVTDMALQLSGTNCAELERLWSTAQTTAQDDAQTGPAIFDHDRILEFAVGRPSAAFGEPYRPFDRDRFIARLPGPPYQFLDRITRIDAAPWVMAPGGKAEAQFDVLPDAWYFAADRQPRMPFAVLLEVALQACGWMAAYMGSALSSDQDLKFRNLGGAGRQHRPVTPHTGTLTTHIHVTKISKTAGMILQHFEFAVSSREGLVYDGNAEFGFFHPSALAQQVGIRDAAPYQASERELAQADAFPFPEGPPWPDERWRMIDRVDAIFSTGGPNGLGLVRGSTRVDPSAWFFSAHFLGDPVWPGSLGIESFLQLLKVAAAERWGVSSATLFESPGLGHDHRWTYRGQIVPTNQAVTVHAAILEFDDVARRVSADGLLEVDGKVIYQMNGFSVRVDRA